MQLRKEDAEKLRAIDAKYKEQDKLAKKKEKILRKFKKEKSEELADNEIVALPEYKKLLSEAVKERSKANSIRTEYIKCRSEILNRFYNRK